MNERISDFGSLELYGKAINGLAMAHMNGSKRLNLEERVDIVKLFYASKGNVRDKESLLNCSQQISTKT